MKRLLVSSLALVAAFALPAAASQRPALDIRITGVTEPTRAGVPVNVQVQYVARAPMTLKQFSFSMRGTSPVSDAPTDSLVLAAGQARTVNVSLVPAADGDEFLIEVVANGVKVVRRRDWSQRWFDVLHYGEHVDFDPQPEPPVVTSPTLELNSPDPVEPPARTISWKGDPVLTLEQARRRAGALGATATETHHLHGSLRFKRPDGKYDHADGVTYVMWLDAPGFDIPVGGGRTTAMGGYGVTATIPTVFGRQFYLTLTTENSWVHVLNDRDDDVPFTYTTSHWQGKVGGGDTDKALILSGKSAVQMHMLTTVTRGFRYLLDHSSYTFPDDIDDVDIDYPESDWPHYTSPYMETIYIPTDTWGWRAGTLLHEFGHHVNYELPIDLDASDTEDGKCEPPGSEGRHCLWCAEDDLDVAVPEGFASFFGLMASREMEKLYGVAPLAPSEIESLPELCNEGGPYCVSCDPMKTEGFFAAVLLDLADDTPGEVDPNADATLTHSVGDHAVPEDRLNLGLDGILQLMASANISSPQDFRNQFMLVYGAFLPEADVWNTWANAGYFLDALPPLPPTNLHSTSHTANVLSTDATISLAWTAAIDFGSGIQKYSLSFYKDNAFYTLAQTTGTTYTTPELPPGTYRFELTSIDLQGNRSTPANPPAVSPNYIVRAPVLTDLNERLIAGWTDGVVARCISGATSTNCTDTPTLAGNQDSTWFAWAVENTGEVPVGVSFRTRLLVDGEPLDSLSTAVILGLAANSQTVINRGPHTIRGGRHTVEAWTDAGESIAESSESNNRWGRQFVWKPLALGRNTDYSRPAPPARLGGSNVITVPVGGTRYYNCDGLSYTHLNSFPALTTTAWIASEIWGEHPGGRGDGANYDLTLHEPSTGSSDGFAAGVVTSSRGAGLTDAVITNSTNTSQLGWQLGVVNTGGNSTSYHARVNPASAIGLGDSVVVGFAANQMVVIRDLDVARGETGRITAEIRRITGSGRFHVSWIASTATSRTLATADGTSETDIRGFGTLSFNAGSIAHYALLVWRDPSDGTAAATVSLKVYRKPADFAIVTPSGWAAPLVPRITGDATAGSALPSAILYGDTQPTWLSASKRNASEETSGSHVTEIRLDDQVAYSATFSGLTGLTTYTSPNLAAPVLPGGRHVLSLLLDPGGVVPELDELNNTDGAQWTWVPGTLGTTASQWRRGQIGGPMAGWEYCRPDEYLYFDCDGVRIPLFTAGSGVGFAAVAVTPRDTADVDIALYDPASTSDAGFEQPLEESYWGRGATELLVLNYALASRKAYDVGIERSSDDTTSYVVDLAPGVTRDPSQNVHGPFTLAAHRLVQVHQFALGAGRHVFHLRNLSGRVDWALAAYDAERPYQNRSQGEERGWSWEAGMGEDEEITFVLQQSANIAIVVHKNGSDVTSLSGTYQLELSTTVADAEGGPVTSTRLAPAFPNPFQGSALVHFELARDEEVALEVYDLRGARVRTLARGRLEAGRHALAWDGRDEAGHRAPAGVYLVRMSTPSYRGQQKLVRVE